MINLGLMSLAELNDLTKQIEKEKADRIKEEKDRYYKAIVKAIQDYNSVIGDPIDIKIWDNAQCDYIKAHACLTIDSLSDELEVVI